MIVNSLEEYKNMYVCVIGTLIRFENLVAILNVDGREICIRYKDQMKYGHTPILVEGKVQNGFLIEENIEVFDDKFNMENLKHYFSIIQKDNSIF